MTANTQRVDVAELQRAIEQAEHKPGEWHVSAFTFGAAAIREAADVPSGFQPFNETIIGNFPWKRDGWLAVAAVNALPALLQQLSELERVARANRDGFEEYERRYYLEKDRAESAESKLAERDAEVEALRHAVERSIDAQRAAERAREGMREQLRIESALLLAWARESREGGWSTHQVDPMKRRAGEIDAFLAANGGRDE